MAESTETPVLDLLARMTADSIEASSLDAETLILARIAALVAAGASKFVLRPLVGGEERVLGQTRRLIDEVLPAVAARWPRK